MQVTEITGYITGTSDAGVNFLQPSDAFQNITDGFIYRQVLQSRQGIDYFGARLAGESRVFGIFEHTLPNGTTKLLVVDANNMYLYNAGTDTFDLIPFGGSMAAYAGFAIASNEYYVSGTSYPTAANLGRFVFTGIGISANGAGSAVFFYDDTSNTIMDFTSVVDNPNYAAPTMGALTRAEFVVWFGERLNFVIPTIGVSFDQGVLYSGIRDASGNGDKFNVPGSGLIQADTYEPITGVSILGQILYLNFSRSNYSLEKTTDVFNPYFIRRIPGVIGTNAKFSPQSWNEIVKSLGKTGIIQGDGRQSLRCDNKINRFTANNISQSNFNLTYGGFDRQNNQFLWTYLKDGSSLTTQDSVLVGNYEEDSWSTFDMRLTVFGQSEVGQSLTWDDISEASGNKSWKKWSTTEEIWDKIGVGESVQKTLAGDDLGFIYELNQDYDDFSAGITNITNADNAVLTVDASSFMAGDLVVVEDVEGMTEINNYDNEDPLASINFVPYTVISATPTSITLNVDSNEFSAYTPNTGLITKVISFRAETIPFNPYRSIGRRCYVSHLEFLLETNGGNLKVDIIEDEYNDTPFKKDVLVYPDQTVPARQWITVTVGDEANFFTFVLKQQSPSSQMRLTSMRIHHAPGGFTSG